MDGDNDDDGTSRVLLKRLFFVNHLRWSAYSLIHSVPRRHIRISARAGCCEAQSLNPSCISSGNSRQGPLVVIRVACGGNAWELIGTNATLKEEAM